jgi:4-diphosphocytidyl-2-C-methyl-D-erythritol kinase
VATEREAAFAKANLCLFLGPTRADGRHELVTLFESVSLADELSITAREAGESDEVVCNGVAGPNLVSEALAGLRAAGWSAPPVRVVIDKRIPVAAGLGGGSADAAALLRRAPALAPLDPAVQREIAAVLGADVPSQVEPGSSLGTGAGEILEPVAVPEHGLLVLPQAFGLSTVAVYREADRLGLPRSGQEIAALRGELDARLGDRVPGRLPDELMVNDLQGAALSLRPEIGQALEMARKVGARPSLVCGSGPTVIGVFWGSDGFDRAAAAARELGDRHLGAVAARPVGRGTEPSAPND